MACGRHTRALDAEEEERTYEEDGGDSDRNERTPR
jgi:hypothetical protein